MARKARYFGQLGNVFEGNPAPLSNCGRDYADDPGYCDGSAGSFDKQLEGGLVFHEPENADNLHLRQVFSCTDGRKSARYVACMDAATHKVQVGQRLRLAIEALNLKQVEVAAAFTVSPPKLGNWLRGDDYPNEWFIFRFCERYSVTTDWLYRGRVSVGMAKPLADSLWEAEQASTPDRVEAAVPET
jgi:transcriptional regulator with XRE-family HTH domain